MIKIQDLYKRNIDEDALFTWMPMEGAEMFQACFNMEIERIAQGEARVSKGRLGYLFSGEVEMFCGKEGRQLVEKSIFAIEPETKNEISKEVRIEAQNECLVVWFDAEVLNRVCYRACWFHARLISEMNLILQL